MKKKVLWTIVFAILIVIIGFFFLRSPKETLQLPVSADQIESISIYYTNEATKKVIDTPENIAFVLQEMERARIFNTYTPGHFPAGGQSFLIRFHLDSGTRYSCVYYQDSDISGYYSDGLSNYRLTSLDFLSVWKGLPLPAIRVVDGNEMLFFPAL